MSAQQDIYNLILKDFEDKDIRIQNVDVQRLWNYFKTIKDISGGGGGGVQSVTGNIANNADPANVVVDQIQADWNQDDTAEIDYIKNKPDVMTKDVYDPAGSAAQVIVSPIYKTVDEAQAFDIGNNGVRGQQYVIYNAGTPLPSLIDIAIITCIEGNTQTKQWSPYAKVHLSYADIWVDANYDVTTNTVTGHVTAKFLISQSGTSDPTLVELENNTGMTWTAGYSVAGLYTLTPSSSLSGFSNVTSEIQYVLTNGSDASTVFGFALSTPDIGSSVINIGTFKNDIVNNSDGKLNNTPVTINLYF